MKTKQAPAAETVLGRRTRVRLMDGVRYGLLVYLAVRIGLSVVALAATALLPHADSLNPAPGS